MPILRVDYLEFELPLVDRILKRSTDITVSAFGLLLTWWIILISFILASADTGKNGFYRQSRIGKHGKIFKTIKIRTMRDIPEVRTNVTTKNDPRITRLGRFFRMTKIDELPQLINVFLGQMALVGPRPDVPGFADKLAGDDRIVLCVRPGITGPATLKYRNEEELLARVKDPERYNAEVIFPDKVRMNREYIRNYSYLNDIKCVMKTIFSSRG